MNPSDVITAALSGDIDEGLDGIIAACGERKKVLSRSLYYTLRTTTNRNDPARNSPGSRKKTGESVHLIWGS
jgi:hypothetical protein